MRWLAHLVEAVAVIAAILSIGAAIAIAAFWLLSRVIRRLAGPQLDEPEEYDPRMDPNGGPIIPIQPGDSTLHIEASKHPPSSC